VQSPQFFNDQGLHVGAIGSIYMLGNTLLNDGQRVIASTRHHLMDSRNVTSDQTAVPSCSGSGVRRASARIRSRAVAS